MLILWAAEFRSIFQAQEISHEKHYGRQKNRGRKTTQKIAAIPAGSQWSGAKARPEDGHRETPQAIQAVTRAVPAKTWRI